MALFEEPNFDPMFVAAFNALNVHCGSRVTVGSGFRTTEQQAALLYKRAQGISVADPGTSRHEGHHGGALDLEFPDDDAKRCMHENANAFGLGFDVPGEAWHLQLSEEGEAALLDGTFAERFLGGAVEEAEPEVDDWGSAVRQIMFGGPGSPENPVEAPERVARAFAPEQAPAAAGQEPEGFVPQASAGFSTGAGGAMSAIDVAKVYAQAGFTGDALVTMVAISRGESGWNPTANGDTSITTGTWGPSMGLSQIRSLNSERGTGGWRDPERLHDPLFNAKAAFAISNGGSNFGPWTVYSKGIYQQYVAEAKAAVSALGTGAYAPKTKEPAASVPALSDDDLALDLDPLDPVGISRAIADELLAARSGFGMLDMESPVDRLKKSKGEEAA